MSSHEQVLPSRAASSSAQEPPRDSVPFEIALRSKEPTFYEAIRKIVTIPRFLWLLGLLCGTLLIAPPWGRAHKLSSKVESRLNELKQKIKDEVDDVKKELFEEMKVC